LGRYAVNKSVVAEYSKVNDLIELRQQVRRVSGEHSIQELNEALRKWREEQTERQGKK